MNTAAIRVGRLLEIRTLSCRSGDDVAALNEKALAEMARLSSSTSIVIVADWRYCPVMSSSAAEHVVVAMTKNNPRMLRSAALASHDSPIAVLQFMRLVRESRHASRRLFFDEHDLTRWLGEVLIDAEKVRLSEFLQQPVERQPKAPGR